MHTSRRRRQYNNIMIKNKNKNVGTCHGDALREVGLEAEEEEAAEVEVEEEKCRVW